MKKIGFLHLLTLAFIVLKLTGYIGWSWLWVLSPLWIYAVLVLSLNLMLAVWEVNEERRNEEAWEEYKAKIGREYKEKMERKEAEKKNT